MGNIIEKFEQRAKEINSLVCVGLDSDFDKIPMEFKTGKFPQFEFNRSIIEQTVEYAAAYKVNSAFYEARGDNGMFEMKMTMDYLQEHYPSIFTINDAKRADIGNTNNGYVTAIFDWLGFDAITLHPYFGGESLKPFLDRADKVSIILCRSSNPGAAEFQDLLASPPPPLGEGRERVPIWQIVAEKTAKDWNKNNNCMLMVGATYPEEMKVARAIIGDMALLVPGIGAQGGDVQAAVEAGLNSKKLGMIINSSRGIIFAENPGEAARQLRDEINKYR